MSIFKKTFAVLLACLMLAGVLPLGALAENGSGAAVEIGDEWDEYDKSYYDPADYEDGESAPSGVITPFADGVDPVHINADPEEEPKREPIEVPSGDCDYSLIFSGQFVAYHSNTALLNEVTAALDIPSPVGAPWKDDPEHIVITAEDGDWRVTVTGFFEAEGDAGYVMLRDNDGMDWMINVRCGYPVHYIRRSFDYDTGTYSEELAYAMQYGSVVQHMAEGWYVLDNSVTFGSSDCVTINGNVNLILCDGYTLNAKDGIYVTAGSVLNIWGQQSDSGRIEASPSSGPGIGGVHNTAGGDLFIYGGTIIANGGSYAAGIGGGEGSSGFGSVVIFGGTVTAKGGKCAAGIGGGQYNSIESVTINGGVVTAKGGEQGAGIGGGEDRAGCTVRINGGTVTATGGSDGGAGLGGGEGGSQGGAVYINGGTVTATGSGGGAGIGGGEDYYGGGEGYYVEINGGTVYATGSVKGGGAANSGPSAGIGGGYDGNGGDVTINGGKVVARAGDYGAAGIGGGYDGTNGNILITGGEVEAVGTDGYFSWGHRDGTGIGAGAGKAQSGSIIIRGGTVIAKGGTGAGVGGGGNTNNGHDGYNGGVIEIRGGNLFASSFSGAGIGGGGSQYGSGNGGNGGNITITGGNVFAISYLKGAGIGGGNDGKGGNVNISGGYTVAIGGYFDYDSNYEMIDYNGPGGGEGAWAFSQLINSFLSDLLFSSEFGGAGIGGGDEESGGNVNITGGTVIASAGMKSVYAIGRGNSGSNNGSLSLYPEAMVSYGKMTDSQTGETTFEGVAPKEQRVSFCMSKNLVKIEPCTHPGADFECIDEYHHTVYCEHCYMSGAALVHVFDEDGDRCTLCGYERVPVTLLPGAGSGDPVSLWASKGEYYTLPGCSFTPPEGKTFSGWRMEMSGYPIDVYPSGSSHLLTSAVTLTAQWTDPYNLWVGGIQVTEYNRNDVLGDGKVTYDPETATLHFANVTELPGVYSGALVYSTGLNLTLTGSAVLDKTGGFANGINVRSGSVTFNGDFDITGAQMNAVLAERDVIFAGGTVTASGRLFGVRANRTMYISDGITRVSSDAESNSALYYTNIVVGASVVITEFVSETGDQNFPNEATHIVFEHGVSVTFVLHGGMLEGSTQDFVSVVQTGGTVSAPDPDPVKPYCDFAGWYADESCTQSFDFTAPVTEDTFAYAKWTITYSVSVEWQDELTRPESAGAVLQRFADEEWVTVQTVTLNEENGWHADFAPVTENGDDTFEFYRIRELDKNGDVVPDEFDEDIEGASMAVFDVEVDEPDPTPEPTEEPIGSRFITLKQIAYYVRYAFTGRKFVTIHNANGAVYTVNNTWDIDLIGGDKPEEIQVALQRRNNWISWDSIEVLTLNAANNWSGTFAEVPVGRINADGKAEELGYRVRQLKARGANDPVPATQEEILAEANARTVYDKWDLDKPYLKNLLEQVGDPLQYWTFEATMKFVKSKVTLALIGNPTTKYHVGAYTDIIGKQIEEHDTKYFIKYDQKDAEHRMELTNIAVLDISVYKRWINFEDDEMPESVYLMLMSKVDDEYAEQVGVEELNIYTPVLTAVYGDRFDISKVTGLDEVVKEGVQAVVGKNIAAEIINGIVGTVMTTKMSLGLAVAKADGTAQNPLNRWKMRLGVKKYGGFGVPMEFAGTELVTGLIEMAVDALIKYLGIPKIHMPVMYEPFDGYWSVKGYAVWYPILDTEDIELTCNVINIKFHGDDDERGTVVGGTVQWENDSEDARPESVQIHVYQKDEAGVRTEVAGSPVTVTKDDGWIWSLEISREDAITLTEDESEDGIIHYAELEIEEEVPTGYEARYEGYDVINRAKELVPPAVQCTRAELRQRPTEDGYADLRFVCEVSFNDSFVSYRGRTYGREGEVYSIDRFYTDLSTAAGSTTVEGRNIFAMYENADGDDDTNTFIYTAVLVNMRPANFDTAITATPYITYSINDDTVTASCSSVTATVNGILNGD